MIAARWDHNGKSYRLVATDQVRSHAPWVLECMGRDAAGGERWDRVKWSGSYGDRPSETEEVLIAGLVALGGDRRALQDSLNYAKGARHG